MYGMLSKAEALDCRVPPEREQDPDGSVAVIEVDDFSDAVLYAVDGSIADQLSNL